MVVDVGQCPALAVDPEEIWGRSEGTSGPRWPQLPADALQAGDPINGHHGLLQPPPFTAAEFCQVTIGEVHQSLEALTDRKP
jgi:hypothetical protein